jgi:lipopolysaccharide transport system ATP-binding protein
MAEIVIKAENISKQYRLGEVSTGSLSHDLNILWHKLRGKENPYLKIGEANDRTKKGNSEYVWALRDIDFDVKQGEVLGIIGRNGAGKSTLLKILSKTTAPTTGQILMKGRVASLLEVGTGFHPDLSGRDNIYLNGAILGMTKKEIKSKFDEIVAFAGVERYIDTPVKRYSSGMYVRLAFAVAAHLEPEILIVDEVLAVGDIEFQKKCLGKMKDVSDKDGRTVLFVSHNMSAIASLCNKAVLLHNGTVKMLDATKKVITEYYDIGLNINDTIQQIEAYRAYSIANSPVYIKSISLVGEDISNKILINEKIYIKIMLRCIKPAIMGALQVLFFNSEGIPTDFAYSCDDNFNLELDSAGDFSLVFSPSVQNLSPGKYTIGIGLTQSNTYEIWDAIHHYPIFEIENKGQVMAYPDRSWAIHHSSNNFWELKRTNEKGY